MQTDMNAWTDTDCLQAMRDFRCELQQLGVGERTIIEIETDTVRPLRHRFLQYMRHRTRRRQWKIPKDPRRIRFFPNVLHGAAPQKYPIFLWLNYSSNDETRDAGHVTR